MLDKKKQNSNEEKIEGKQPTSEGASQTKDFISDPSIKIFEASPNLSKSEAKPKKKSLFPNLEKITPQKFQIQNPNQKIEKKIDKKANTKEAINKNTKPQNTPKAEIKITPESKKTNPKIDMEKDTQNIKNSLKKTEEKNTHQNPKNNGNFSGTRLFFVFLGIGTFLLFIFYGMLLWGLLSGNLSSSVFTSFGIEPAGLKELLITITNIVFGGLSLIFFITTIIFLFRRFMVGKQAINRKTLTQKSGIYAFLCVAFVAIWLVLYWFITQFETGKTVIDKKISLITTTPSQTVGVTAPIQIKFDLTEKLYAKINPNLIRQINWDFNQDGITDASGDTVTHRFLDKGPNNGRFLIKADISYNVPSKKQEVTITTETEVIIANEAIQAIISATPETGITPAKIELNALESKDPDGEIIFYEWDLDNDGDFEIQEQNATVVEKTFEASGDHKVSLRVTGTNNDSDTVTKIIKINSPKGTLRANISTEGVLEGYPPLKILFDGSNSFIKEGKIVRYEWLFEGEKEAIAERKIAKIFREPGTYKVILRVQNDVGEKHETEKSITVLEEPIDGKAIIKTTPALTNDEAILRGILPFKVTFDGSSSQIKNAIEWQWDFESDGAIDSYGKNIKKTFDKAGNYDVQLRVLDASEKIYIQNFKVLVEKAGTRARIEAKPQAGEVPLTVEFDASGSSTDKGEIVDYIWQFPEEEPIHYGAKISYLFKSIGNFPVKLTVLTSEQQTATAQYLVSARAPYLRAKFSTSPKRGSAPLKIRVNPTASSGIVKEYLWDFGDNTIQRQLNTAYLEHTYKKPGIYKVKLKLVGLNGVVSEHTETVEVTDPE